MTKLSRGMLPFHRLFSEGRHDDHPVCHDGSRLILWREFADRVSGAAALFRSRPESSWLLDSDDLTRFIVDLSALCCAGKRIVIPPNTLPGTLESLSARCGARCSALDVFRESAGLSGVRDEAVDPLTTIIDLYTSGSVAEPKKIQKTLAQFEMEASVLEAQWGVEAGDAAVVATAPYQHIYGLLFRLFWPLSAGRLIDAVTCVDPAMLSSRMAVFHDAVLVSNPAHLSRWPELIDFQGAAPKPRMIFSSGGPLPAAVAGTFYAKWARAPVEVFGSTETGGIAWRVQDERADAELWTPFRGIEARQSENGALLLSSPYLSASPYETEDRVELMPDGRFRSLGRLDRVVKIEETRVSLPEMENHLLKHPWITQAALLPLSGKRQSLGAAILLGDEGKRALDLEGRPKITRSLRKFLSAYYDKVLIPRYWRFPDAIPLNERGKVSGAALARLFTADRAKEEYLPKVLGRRLEEPGKLVLDLEVLPALSHFAGHFPELPILPGVVQIDWAVHYAKKYLSIDGAFSSLENVKFLALVFPGTCLQLSLAWNRDSGRLDFCYASADRRFSAGRFVFAR